MSPDPYGRAIRDHHRGKREAPLIDRDGTETREHDIGGYYFGDHRPESWFEPRVDGPLLDMGAGAGRDTLYFQERVDTVAIDPSEHLIETMRERGVEDARVGDMFALREQFGRDRFGAALSVGSQLQLAASDHALQQFLADLAYVTTPDATAMLDGYDPDRAVEAGVFAVRDDPTPGLAHRVYHSEYEGEVSRTLQFRLFSVDRLREAAVGTPWDVVDAMEGHPGDEESVMWRALLEKPQ
ncbi:class I SAM-dependent methyltransferase [Halolamina salifodinae]|uniref:SAM-dependent methyltransferase n=1 Tax=Halolamina salifodinae TaxID=1202767 RepID=A0A8T4GYG3_9EURY|nr:class I SAM-dependent methyltransferase [Halolamina salifodinae]MBP1988036.1 SAM-dependent methyltransferase [Halolamina salifodinae]